MFQLVVTIQLVKVLIEIFRKLDLKNNTFAPVGMILPCRDIAFFFLPDYDAA